MSQSRSVGLTILVLVTVGVAIIVLPKLLRQPPAPNGPEGRVAADPVKALESLHSGIALMENARYDTAAEQFAELAKQLPDELAVRQNLAVASVLAIAPEALDKVRNAEKFQSGLTRADDAVAKLLEKANKSPVAHLLVARLAEQREDRKQQLEELEVAAKFADGHPAFETEVYVASRMSDDSEMQKHGSAALRRAADKDPDNLWLLSERLVVEANEKDAGIAKTLAQAKQTCRPFVELIKKLRNIDLTDFLTKAEEAASKQDWNTVTRNARLVSNMLKPEIATKHDQRRVSKHLLEYVVHDFSPAWYEKHAVELAKSTPVSLPIEVTFEEAAARDQLPSLAGIRDVKIADFDLDGRWDVIVLLSGQVIVFGQPEISMASSDKSDAPLDNGRSRWVTLCEAVVPSGMTKLLVCDLDRDTEETPDEHRFVGQRKPSVGRISNPSGKTDAGTKSADGVNAGKEKDGLEIRSTNLDDGSVERAEDADPDVLVYGSEGVQFLRNVFDPTAKTRSLQVVSQENGLDTLRDVLAIAPADLDHDGDLDLVVSSDSGMSLWQNNDSREHTKFADISSRSSLPSKDLKATVLLPVDWNFDVQTDVLATGPNVEKPGYLENISHGRFRWQELPAEFSLAKTHGLRLAELQVSPLSWSLFASTDKAIQHIVGAPPQIGEQREFPDGLSGFSVSDFDNDGQRDWLAWGHSQVMTNLRHRGPAQASRPEQSTLFKQPTPVTLCDVADFDGDGDEDVLVISSERPIWIRNDGGNKNGWIDLSIRADKDRKPQRDSERVNAHGVGSLVELRAAGLPDVAGRKQHVLIVEGQSMHFGLGSAKQVDAVRIVWTNGIPQNILHPKAGEAIAAQQTLKGSCPYLYTWDGEQFAFYTDCLWAAPIGLQLAEGVLAPSREWEYLKIDGDRLREVNGEYRLMLTEELWEAAYFDQVRLLAIDHPADVEVFSNEKVGPPSISEFKLHPVRKRHVPVAARDHRGRDVLPKIAKRDEQYLRAFDKILQQGLAEEHFIELDLGDLTDAHRVTLFLTGWVFPTDTSINVSLSQNPDLDGPKPPSIWVPGNAESQSRGDAVEDKKWREAIPYIGFPGGKTKTIAVDVTEALGLAHSPLATRYSQLRIVTSMELYWDEMFFTVDEPEAEYSINELPMLSADLQYRGFSARLPHAELGPERFDAANVTTSPQWPPMGGKFTRYGDVLELLTQSDDKLAILGAGDAVTMRFQAEKPISKLPPGWKRDFILHNVGWDKDADLNTVYGQFVEPLPFRAMRGYPDPKGDEYPESPAHNDYLRRYQTREQSRSTFWNGR